MLVVRMCVREVFKGVHILRRKVDKTQQEVTLSPSAALQTQEFVFEPDHCSTAAFPAVVCIETISAVVKSTHTL